MLLIVIMVIDQQLLLCGHAPDLDLVLPRAGKLAAIWRPGKRSYIGLARWIVAISALLVHLDLPSLSTCEHIFPDYKRSVNVSRRDVHAIRGPGKSHGHLMVREIPAGALALASLRVPEKDRVMTG